MVIIAFVRTLLGAPSTSGGGDDAAPPKDGCKGTPQQ